ncbi:MAG TPA: hypothetical protein VEC01_05410 [Noviherbaspirillum sp.]|uniref:hypothetical protein n=1 Tax=Noviherbaspirillum sp. TaxID=1926288 RepID=UPI002D37EBED|nr:hypothetical protein [Noviherbaspirillum sp.]HYD94744.1 hypothetical protein [Noviherbaspirillum sp.]
MTTSDTKQQTLVTRTAQTEQRYRQLFAMFRKLAQQALDAGMADATVPEPVRMVAIFLAREASWSAATARTYRASLVFGLQQLDDEAVTQALEMLYHVGEDAEDRMRRQMSMQEERRQRKEGRPVGGQQKAKRFSKAQVNRLLAELHTSRSQWADATSDWFMAGALTGLRPCEWCRAELIDSDGLSALRVQNAKATNGRSHGPNRTILLADLDGWQRALIVRHLVRVQGYARQERFEKMYEACRQLIRDAADRVFPKDVRHPTLYTARHMFAASVKTMFSQAEVAALMGHASIETAGRHYAERWSASGVAGVRPSNGDVEAVLNRNSSRSGAEPLHTFVKKVHP